MDGGIQPMKLHTKLHPPLPPQSPIYVYGVDLVYFTLEGLNVVDAEHQNTLEFAVRALYHASVLNLPPIGRPGSSLLSGRWRKSASMSGIALFHPSGSVAHRVGDLQKGSPCK
jgi:hypothetical protein